MNEATVMFVTVRGCRLAVQRHIAWGPTAICSTRMSSTESNKESIENLRSLQNSILARRRSSAELRTTLENCENPTNSSNSSSTITSVSRTVNVVESNNETKQLAVTSNEKMQISTGKEKRYEAIHDTSRSSGRESETKALEKNLTKLNLAGRKDERSTGSVSNVAVNRMKSESLQAKAQPVAFINKNTNGYHPERGSRTPFGLMSQVLDGQVLLGHGRGQRRLRKMDGSLPFRARSQKASQFAAANLDTVFVQIPLIEEFEIPVPFKIAEESFLPRINLLDKVKSCRSVQPIVQDKAESSREEPGLALENEFGDVLNSLNSQQVAAVTAEVDKACLVLAGPGSGKTRVLTHRAAYLCRRYNLSPHRILAVTFTNKAAGEMKSRLNELLFREGSSAREKLPSQSDFVVGTFHSICARILRAHGETIGINSDFQICDTADAKQVLVNLLRKISGDGKSTNLSNEATMLAKQISRVKNHDAAEMMQMYAPHVYKKIVKFRTLYDAELRKMNHLDFDDLLLETRNLLEKSEESRRELQNRYQHVLVDEWQDTNVVQFDIVSKLAQRHKNLFVVGDDDQAIFKFRGADVRNLQKFAKTFPERQEIRLERNYRSTGCIVDAAQNVIRMNRTRPGKTMHTTNPKGTPVVICNAYDDRHEAWYVVKSIKDMLRDNRIKSFSEVAVLYRTNMQSRVLEEACIQASLPYRIVGGIRFYDRLEVKDVMSYVRLVVNPSDDIALLRAINTPNRGIGAKTIEALREVAEAQQLSLLGALETLFNMSDTDGAKDVQLRKTSMKKLADFYFLIEKLRVVAAEVEKGEKASSAAQLIDEILTLTNYKAFLEKRTKSEDATGAFNKFEERWMNVVELQSAAARFPTPQEFMQSVSLLALSSDTVEEGSESIEAITLLTLHSGKGLEFSAVFMVGVDEGTLPMIRSHEGSEQERDEIEEERRLAFVGMTRAKKYLSISHRSRGLTHGRHGSFWRDYKPSRFLDDIPKNLTSFVRAYSKRSQRNSVRSFSPSNSSRTGEAATSSDVPKELQIGDSVRCTTMGRGTIIDKKDTVSDALVEVLFASGKRQYMQSGQLQLLYSPFSSAR